MNLIFGDNPSDYCGRIVSIDICNEIAINKQTNKQTNKQKTHFLLPIFFFNPENCFH
jgi:hypothetical protein